MYQQLSVNFPPFLPDAASCFVAIPRVLRMENAVLSLDIIDDNKGVRWFVISDLFDTGDLAFLAEKIATYVYSRYGEGRSQERVVFVEHRKQEMKGLQNDQFFTWEILWHKNEAAFVVKKPETSRKITQQ